MPVVAAMARAGSRLQDPFEDRPYDFVFAGEVLINGGGANPGGGNFGYGYLSIRLVEKLFRSVEDTAALAFAMTIVGTGRRIGGRGGHEANWIEIELQDHHWNLICRN